MKKHLLVLACIVFFSSTALAQSINTQQVTFELSNGGYVVVDIELPEGVDSVYVELREFDVDGTEITEESESITTGTPTRTPRPTRTPHNTSTPRATRTPTLTATSSPTSSPFTTAGKVTTNANLRSGPGVSYEALATANAGDSVSIAETSADGYWYKLDNGYWISASLVDTTGSSSSLPATSTSLNYGWNYNDLMRSDDRFGEELGIKGTVIQNVGCEDSACIALVFTDSQSDVVLIIYQSERPLLFQNDSVDLSGIYMGASSYETAQFGTNTVPNFIVTIE